MNSFGYIYREGWLILARLFILNGECTLPECGWWGLIARNSAVPLYDYVYFKWLLTSRANSLHGLPQSTVQLFISWMTGQSASLLNASLSVREVWGSISELDKVNTVSPTARHRCDLFSELCCTGADLWRRISSLVARFAVIQRV